jgi:hypothetical protein
MNSALPWHKSSYSGSQGGDCVEVATNFPAVHIRDTKTASPVSPVLHVAPAAWTAFLGLAREGGNG